MKYDTLEQRVDAAKVNQNELEELISEYLPFIRKKATEIIPSGNYDSYSTTAMSAFAEAVQSFEKTKGSFLGFAALVIRRRITDQARKEYKAREIPVEEMNLQATYDGRSGIAMEISMFKEELAEYGISLTELTKVNPKHKSSREKTNLASQVLAETSELLDYLTSNKKVPIGQLSSKSGVPVKLLEKKRKYIIARALLHQDKYGYLKDYIR